MRKILSIAALALVGAVMTGCSSDEEVVVVPEVETPQQPADNVVTLTTTIGFDGDDATRALNIVTEGTKKTLAKTFAENDQVAVIYKNTSDQTVKALSDALPAGVYGSSTEITVTLTNPKPDSPVRFIYPAAMAAATVATDAAVNADATVNYAALATQDGTQATLGSTYDLAIYDGTLTSDAKLPSSVMLDNKLAICAYTIKDNATPTANDITNTITSLTVYAGSDTYTVTRTGSTDPIFVAIRPLTTATDIAYVASDGTNSYVKSVTGKQYAANNVYNLGLRMTAGKDLSKLTGDYEVQNGETLTGTLGGNYKISIAGGATVTLMGVTINGVNDSSCKWAGITCPVDATIMVMGTNTVKGFDRYYPGIYIEKNKTLTIKGSGSLTASSNGEGCGIGGGHLISCGNIVIEGGSINATGGTCAAGIGGGYRSNCGNITINGGTIYATGGDYAAGIGSGSKGGGSSGGFISPPPICGNITIGSGVTSVTATSGGYGAQSIGAGVNGSCGTISIADTSKVTEN